VDIGSWRIPEETNHRTRWGNHQVASPANNGLCNTIDIGLFSTPM